jgi:hypothetical protein
MRAALVLSVVLLLVPASGAGAARFKAPSGEYKGSPGEVLLSTSRNSIAIAAFSFRCDSTRGRTGVNEVPVKRTRKGYRFSIRTHGSVSFEDGRPDNNVAIDLRGRFSRTAKTVRGTFRVRGGPCRTGDVAFVATRSRR